MVDVVRTNYLHPFSLILTIFSGIPARIVAPPSGNFKICSVHWKGLFILEKSCKRPHQNRPTNADAMSCGNRTEVVELRKRDTKTAHTLSPYTEVRCSISTNLCMNHPCRHFPVQWILGLVNSLAARGKNRKICRSTRE